MKGNTVAHVCPPVQNKGWQLLLLHQQYVRAGTCEVKTILLMKIFQTSPACRLIAVWKKFTCIYILFTSRLLLPRLLVRMFGYTIPK